MLMSVDGGEDSNDVNAIPTEYVDVVIKCITEYQTLGDSRLYQCSVCYTDPPKGV